MTDVHTEPLLEQRLSSWKHDALRQLQVMILKKHWIVRKRSHAANFQVFALPVLGLFLCWLLYYVFHKPSRDSTGYLELIIVPLALIMLMQSLVVQVVAEKSARLLESMKIMSLREGVYWAAHALESLCVGVAVALVVATFSVATTLFNHGDWGSIFGLILAFAVAIFSLGFAITAVIESPQTAGQVALACQIACLVVFLSVLKPDVTTEKEPKAAQVVWSLLPHVALELGVNSFRGPPTEDKHPRPAGPKRLRAGCHSTHALYTVGCDGNQSIAGVVNYDDDAVVSAIFNETGSRNATYRRFYVYTQYHGIQLPTIIGILFVDAMIYCFLSWYLAQVIPSEFGARKPFWFIFLPSYWCEQSLPGFTKNVENAQFEDSRGSLRIASDAEDINDVENPLYEISQPSIDETAFEKDESGDPASVVIDGLRKVFGNFVAVNDLKFEMCEGRIFSLLGHNGAGKSTAINVLTGLLPSDSMKSNGGATIYGHAIRGDMDRARKLIGLCLQHETLFDLLTAREHLDFFASLKGSSDDDAAREAEELLECFHLSHRANHKAHELSGGMRRKLSTAVALCGRSKFVLLDEDALARRELWDLLAASKAGRTMLLTTHYMDEADVLGDRIGILAHGKMRCVGSSAFLKRHFGTGYRVICESETGSAASLAKTVSIDVDGFDTLLGETVPGARRVNMDSDVASRSSRNGIQSSKRRRIEAILPRDGTAKYPAFFTALDDRKTALGIANYGLTITTLEEVFLAVGADETVAPGAWDQYHNDLRIGGGRQFFASTATQIAGIAEKKLRIAVRDYRTVALLFLPIAGAAAGFALNSQQVISKKDNINDYITAGIAAGSWLIYPALVAEGVVREREKKLRAVLTVTGCEVRAYWVGTFIGDYCLFIVAAASYWIAAISSGLTRWLENAGIFYFILEFGGFIIAYSYFISFAFSSAKRCVVTVPGIQIAQLLAPQILGLLAYLVIHSYLKSFSFDQEQGMLFWLLTLLSPQGAFWLGFYNIANSIPVPQKYCPRFYVIMVLMAAELVAFASFTYIRDLRTLQALERNDPSQEVINVSGGDDDVRAECRLVLGMTQEDNNDEQTGLPVYTLIVKNLRKVYPSKSNSGEDTVAVHNCTFRVARGEVFGLLGANGAGKSTTLNMILRETAPTTGDVLVDNHSVLDDFEEASKVLGVVSQENTLWDYLTCADHLKLFAQLRGVPSKYAKRLVEAALDQLELRPHANKLASRLSGGMKRKLCTAVSIVGDPGLVLLDEPSAGLDPVSRRNLWNVLRATMEARAVVLTSHLMEEVEALCDRVSIMVKGKLRCMGTLQHLKASLGSNYQMDVAAPPAKQSDVEKLVDGLFGARARLTSSIGGMLSFEVKREAMRVGKAFEAFERQKVDLHISDYSISQPSLESVFIKTVKEYDSDDQFAVGYDMASPPAPRMTGCTRKQHRVIAWTGGVLAFACVVASIFYMKAATVLIFCILMSIWGSVGCCCVLRPPPIPE